MVDSPSAAPLIAHNRSVILAALRAAGIASVAASYSGMGDEGQMEEITTEPPEAEALEKPVQVLERTNRYIVEENRWESTDVPAEMSLEEAIEGLVYEILEERRPGWEINEGSRGTLTLNVAEGSYELDHVSHFCEYETETLCG